MKANGLSVIVPCLNEAEGIMHFCNVIDIHAESLTFPLDLIFVDDGSTDGTGDLIRAHQFRNVKMIQLITFSKNFGSHAAIRAGISKARFDLCTWMGSAGAAGISPAVLGQDRGGI